MLKTGKTEEVVKQLDKIISHDNTKEISLFTFKCLIFKWLEGKQVNRILSTISVLVASVFFIFTISPTILV